MLTDVAHERNSAMTRHDEWLVDEANRDSFPASDPASSTQPGSIVGERYASGAHAAAVSTVDGPMTR
jgi:hypothetical protein